jgi:hypothetical protein
VDDAIRTKQNEPLIFFGLGFRLERAIQECVRWYAVRWVKVLGALKPVKLATGFAPDGLCPDDLADLALTLGGTSLQSARLASHCCFPFLSAVSIAAAVVAAIRADIHGFFPD